MKREGENITLDQNHYFVLYTVKFHEHMELGRGLWAERRDYYSKNLSILSISSYSDCTADTNLLKIVPVEILLNFGNYFRTLQLGF